MFAPFDWAALLKYRFSFFSPTSLLETNWAEPELNSGNLTAPGDWVRWCDKSSRQVSSHFDREFPGLKWSEARPNPFLFAVARAVFLLLTPPSARRLGRTRRPADGFQFFGEVAEIKCLSLRASARYWALALLSISALMAFTNIFRNPPLPVMDFYSISALHSSNQVPPSMLFSEHFWQYYLSRPCNGCFFHRTHAANNQ